MCVCARRYALSECVSFGAQVCRCLAVYFHDTFPHFTLYYKYVLRDSLL